MGKRFRFRPLFRPLIALLLLMPAPAAAQDRSLSADPEIEVHLDLTRQFYEALRQADTARDRSLSTDPSVHYLEQIAVSTRFMVETNLRLLREQAEIKALLRELLNSSKK
jgi:hypothetical protein